MKRLIVLLIMACSIVPVLVASDGMHQQRLSEQEFRAKQQAYITEKAGLTKDEAERFFPVYFELQDKKKKLNDEAWGWLRKGKQEGVTEEQYSEILEEVYDARIAAERLEKTFFEKFRKILSSEKIYKVMRAEMRFHRDLLKEMRKGSGKEKE